MIRGRRGVRSPHTGVEVPGPRTMHFLREVDFGEDFSDNSWRWGGESSSSDKTVLASVYFRVYFPEENVVVYFFRFAEQRMFFFFNFYNRTYDVCLYLYP